MLYFVLLAITNHDYKRSTYMNINETEPNFIRHFLLESLTAWNRASISLIDIRHNTIDATNPLSNYTIPTSGFVFVITTNGTVILNDTTYKVEHFGLYHGGKHTLLSILPIDDWLEYYLILYRQEKTPYSNLTAKSLKYHNPFQIQYGFTPHNPLFFIEQLKHMYERWNAPTPMNVFYGKASFYQFVYKLHEELEQGNIQILQPDLIGMAIRYLEQNYNKPIVITEMSKQLGVSYSHFHRMFKKQTKKSPQEYLIEIRLNFAKKWLIESDCTVREISLHCGFPDPYNFHRLFLKHIKMTPMAYREKSSLDLRDSNIENIISNRYTKNNLVSINKPRLDGGNYMYKEQKNKPMLVAALSLMLLLTACSSTTNQTLIDSNKTVTQQDQDVPEAADTKTITTIMGDVKVPVNPQRIGVWVYEQQLNSLGVTPISISDGNFRYIWPDLPTFSYEPDKEELLSLEPDLLITYEDENFFNKYNEIAPVISIPLTWTEEETLMFLGEVLNKKQEATQVIKDFHEKSETIKKNLEASNILGKTVALIEPIQDQIWIYDNAYGRGGSILYDYLDFSLSDNIKEALNGNHFVSISYEVLPTYCDTDYIVVVKGESYDSLKENPVWKTLPAVQAGHIIEFDTAELDGRGLSEKTMSYFSDSFLNILQ